jgi:hypothetical protein
MLALIRRRTATRSFIGVGIVSQMGSHSEGVPVSPRNALTLLKLSQPSGVGPDVATSPVRIPA